MSEIQQTFAIVSIHLAVSVLLAFVFLLISKTEKRYLLLVFSIFFLATIAILFIPNLPILERLNWNWQGKLLSFLLALAFVYFLPFLTSHQAGFSFKINKSVWLPLIILVIISISYNIYESGFLGIDKSKEYLLFQLTMPGLSEEPVFRGVLLGLLNLVFISRKKILGAVFGWGALIQCVLFAVGHAIYFDEKQHLQFYSYGFVTTFSLGAIMTYLKEKGESIIPAIIFHNLFNASMPIISLFL